MGFDLLAQGFGKSFLLVLAALLPILNPIASAPVFIGLTDGFELSVRRNLARIIARNVVALMLGAILVGSYVLDFFNISLPIVRIGGGVILIAYAWRMLNAPTTAQEGEQSFKSIPQSMIRQFAFYPLTFPATCGPASISIAITIGVALNTRDITLMLANTAGGAVALVVIGLLINLAFHYADRLLKALGQTGSAVFIRLSAFILLCVGIEIFWQGVSELLSALLHPSQLALAKPAA